MNQILLPRMTKKSIFYAICEEIPFLAKHFLMKIVFEPITMVSMKSKQEKGNAYARFDGRKENGGA